MISIIALDSAAGAASAQEHWPADRAAPGDAMIQQYLARETAKVECSWLPMQR